MIPFHFRETDPNQLFMNPKALEKEKKDLLDLKAFFEKKYGSTGYFLVPSSGSSTSENRSVKLIALHVQAVLNSAQRVNDYFQISKTEKWGCVLPTFHVAGLGIYARAFLSGSEVVQGEWNADQFASWIENNQINIISLVPAQIFDLVQRKTRAPKSVRVVFVGGAKLSKEHREQIVALGWPIWETYGMTETGSMISCAQEGLFEVLPGVDVVTLEGKLKIKCNSLMTCALQKVDTEIFIYQSDQGWLHTEDQVEIIKQEGKTFLQLQGRSQDFIKINGEGVSLPLLRETFGDHPQIVLIPISHERSEYQMAVVCESQAARATVESLIQKYNGRVRPFEKVKRLYQMDQLPKSDLGKIKYKLLEQLVQGIKDYETL